jgi:RNA recognition motif-containing protein
MYVSFLETESRQKTIYVTNLPCEMPAQEVVNSYSPFGTVTRITAVTDDLGIETGERLIVMTLTEHIPHCLKIQGFFVFNRYRGQPPSCFFM